MKGMTGADTARIEAAAESARTHEADRIAFENEQTRRQLEEKRSKLDAEVSDLRRREKHVEDERLWIEKEIDHEVRKAAASGWNRKVEQAFARVAALDAGLRYTSERLEKIVANREAKENQLTALRPNEKGK